jgi:carbamoyl-phosphate synthase large subunit
LPKSGTIFMSLSDRTKRHAVGLGSKLTELGFQLIATGGTAKLLAEAGIAVRQVKKLQEGHPNLLDLLIDGEIHLIFNTPSGKGARTDEGRIRAASVSHGVPCITTIQAADAAVRAMEALREEDMTVQALQDRLSPELSAARAVERSG